MEHCPVLTFQSAYLKSQISIILRIYRTSPLHAVGVVIALLDTRHLIPVVKLGVVEQFLRLSTSRIALHVERAATCTAGRNGLPAESLLWWCGCGLRDNDGRALGDRGRVVDRGRRRQHHGCADCGGRRGLRSSSCNGALGHSSASYKQSTSVLTDFAELGGMRQTYSKRSCISMFLNKHLRRRELPSAIGLLGLGWSWPGA